MLTDIEMGNYSCRSNKVFRLAENREISLAFPAESNITGVLQVGVHKERQCKERTRPTAADIGR